MLITPWHISIIHAIFGAILSLIFLINAVDSASK